MPTSYNETMPVDTNQLRKNAHQNARNVLAIAGIALQGIQSMLNEIDRAGHDNGIQSRLDDIKIGINFVKNEVMGSIAKDIETISNCAAETANPDGARSEATEAWRQQTDPQEVAAQAWACGEPFDILGLSETPMGEG